MLELDHVAIIVSKIEHLEFYRLLGFKETNRFTRSYDTVVLMECNGITLEIFVDQNHPERINNPEAMGLRHIAFSVDDLEKLNDEIEIKPIRQDWFGRRFTFTKDMDGQTIELIEKK